MILRVLYPPSVLAPAAPYARRVNDNVLAATIAREQAAAARAERDKRELEDTLHHPWAWILAAAALAIVPAGLLGGLRVLALRPRALDRQRRRSTCTSRPTIWRPRSCRRCSPSASWRAATSWRRRSSSSCAAAATR